VGGPARARGVRAWAVSPCVQPRAGTGRGCGPRASAARMGADGRARVTNERRGDTGGEVMSYEGSYDYTSPIARIVRAVSPRADISEQ
jgi:hypothetical protein